MGCGRNLASVFRKGIPDAWGQFVNGGPDVPQTSDDHGHGWGGRVGGWEVNGGGFARGDRGPSVTRQDLTRHVAVVPGPNIYGLIW